ncbi:MAG: DUF433 domain-containing protein [Caldilineaceae bacterium]|nr:DUF433 domain-containing protein [Caldilineaceae bacterium]
MEAAGLFRVRLRILERINATDHSCYNGDHEPVPAFLDGRKNSIIVAPTIDSLIEKNSELRGGRLVIAGIGATVRAVASLYKLGLSAEEIATQHPRMEVVMNANLQTLIHSAEQLTPVEQVELINAISSLLYRRYQQELPTPDFW